ncbi:MAG TPA: CusA/CzcA family heavy metal efflux RND transporter [Terriglobia bacterium]|nr:CusA/CzcA family heavy metal efflux RND transporter [Terriglobia bacterium]
MLNRLIDLHLHHRWLVLVGLGGLITVGLWSLSLLSIDAFPDLTNNQVVVVTEARGMAPVEVEQLVTFPIEAAMMGVPRTLQVRSVSKLGLSLVTVVFEDSVNLYFARQLVNERLQDARGRIPPGLEPSLGPVATAFGELYQYTIEGKGHSAMDLKTLHDWELKYQLRALPGVSEVNTWGGFTQQYHVIADPVRLRSYALSLRDVFERLRENNENFGGGFIEHASEQYTVRGLGRARSIVELNQIVLTSHDGTPVYLRDVADVRVGPMPRQGAVTRGAKGETVSGMIIMLKGENGMRVIERVKNRLAEMTKSLPAGISVVPFYDQSTVIDGTIRTVRNNLLEGGALVVVVLFLFLRNVPAALIVASVIPLSMLVGFIGMRLFGISANLMSLGAIDFGLIVDGSVVMMENFVRRLHQAPEGLAPRQQIRSAAHEVGRPIVFGIAIIIAVYLPILSLEGLEGRMFRPMAVTVCSALLGSLVLALTVVPAAASLVFRKPLTAHDERWFNKLRAQYTRVLNWVLPNRRMVVTGAALLVVTALASLLFIGTEFMPRLDEGSLLIETRKLPSVSLSESVAISTEIERIIQRFPEVADVVTKIGRPDLATEAMGIYQGDVYVMLRPRSQWPNTRTKEQLVEAMAQELGKFPGVAYNFTQPMAMRLDEVVSGVKADVAVKIFGEDERVLNDKAEQVLRILSRVPGAADVQKEVFAGAAEWQVQLNRPELARYGLNVADVRDVIESAVGGRWATEVIEGQKRFAVVLRLPEASHQDRQALGELQLKAPDGELVLLSRVAEVRQLQSPEIVNREDGQRRMVVQANVRGRDLGSFVSEARQMIEGQVALPPGYYYRWGGQFENQQSAMARLAVVLPVVIVIIFGLLFASFDSVKQALLILLNVPFASVGGIAALWLRDMNLNLSAAVGFIALFGVAVLNGVVMVSSIQQLMREGWTIEEGIRQGALNRLRPVLMTALVASLGFVPMALATSAGAEIQRPLATVVIGGLLTSTLLTLVVLPSLFPICCEKQEEA